MAQFFTDFKGRKYHACVNAVAVSAAQDVFEIVTPSTHRIAIKAIRIGQYSDAGDSAAELLSVLVLRGYTVSGSGGSSVTPTKNDSGAPASACTVEANNTTVANTGTPVTLLADVWNVQAPFLWLAEREDDGFMMNVSERIVIRITAPADGITLNATLVYEEASP